MPQRMCSSLGTVLLVLAVASPAWAQDSKEPDEEKKGSEASPSKDEKPAKKRKKKAKDEPEEKKADEKKDQEKTPEPEKEEEPLPDDSVWERPPAEEEKPIARQTAGVRVVPDLTLAEPWSTGLILGYGFMTDRRNSRQVPQDPYGLALGIRGGYTLDFDLYLGLHFLYYLGSSGSGGITGSVGSESTSANYIQFGVEAGYDWSVGPVVVRPSLQIGPAIAVVKLNSGETVSVTEFLFAPGISVVAPIDSWFIGGEGRFVLVAGDGPAAFLIAANVGLRF